MCDRLHYRLILTDQPSILQIVVPLAILGGNYFTWSHLRNGYIEQASRQDVYGPEGFQAISSH